MTESKKLVFEIDPHKKYIIQFKGEISREELEGVIKGLDEWIKSDKPFAYMVGDIELHKVSE